jgi:UDP-N-acetylglucosamine diphosphorylase/glucosamine-1-phosphate N-acetyltransferase
MNQQQVAVIILAAGMGTRMKSDKAKVLHALCGRPMIDYVVTTAKQISDAAVILVIGHQARDVRQVVAQHHDVTYAYQTEQLGTGHAVQCALPLVPDSVADVIILCGDVPLLSANTLNRFLQAHQKAQRDISILGVTLQNPYGYGRLVMDAEHNLKRVVEEADATPSEKAIDTVNSGIYCVAKECLAAALPQITADNAQREYYLTDIIGIGYRAGHRLGVMVFGNEEEVLGINTLQELQRAEQILRRRKSERS